MEHIKLIDKLIKLNIHVKVENNDIRIIGDNHKISNDIIEELKACKKELIIYLSTLNKNEIDNEINSIQLTEISNDNSYEVSSSQKRLWILSQLEGGSMAYNMPSAFKIKGKLNKEKFEESFRQLIGRHEILRTYFKINEEGEVRQHIVSEEQIIFNIEIVDYTKIGNQKQAIDTYLLKKNTEEFDLELAPLVRASLIKCKEDEFVFFLLMHHIVSDGWSNELIVSELIQIYNGLIEGIEINLPELQIQYKDYVGWLSQETNKEKYQASEKYWIEQFSGEIPVLDLPNFKTRPLVQTYNGDSRTHVFSKKFLERIKAFSQDHDSTLFMIIMTGIKSLLYRYSGQDDIIVGIPIAGREHPDLENQIGLYLNTLAIRTKFKEKNSFLDLAKNEKEVLMAAYANQQYPFDELVEKLNLKRDKSRSVLFDVMVVLQNQIKFNDFNKFDEVKGLYIESYEYDSKTSHFDISFTFLELEELVLTIEYNTDIYDSFLIERMFCHFENILTEAMNMPNVPIEEIEYLTEVEKKQLVAFNFTDNEYLKDKTVIDLIEEQVEKTPNNIAVVFEDIQLTYAELNDKSNQLSNYLLELNNLCKGDFIGISIEKSEFLIIALLGVLKAGYAYVLIDPSFPEERFNYILEDSKCKLLIDEKFIEKTKSILDSKSKDNPNIKLNLEDVIYLMYTSGSTGNPKGAINIYRGFTNTVKWYAEKIGENDKIGVISNVSFDLTQKNYFASLIVGASIYLDSDFDPINTRKFIKDNEISVINCAPILFYSLIDENLEDLISLKKVILGGESIKLELIKDFLRNYDVEIFNSYGPSEASDVSVEFQLKKEQTDLIPIGKPIRNSKIFILDKELNEVPTGVIGDICIGGIGLGLGYLGNEKLTKDKFIYNSKYGYIYKSGDIGRWLPDGNIEFCGRKDNQVKIRGYRIELEEIETKISLYSENIKDVVVDAKEMQGDKILVAYVVSHETLNKLELRKYLQTKVPEYMVPNFFVELESLPQTSSGKIDRKALPFVLEEDIIRKEYMAPQDEIDIKLVSIWSDILYIGKEKISLNDDFFELGGHSIRVFKLANEIANVFQVKVSIKELFRYSILEDQLKLIKNSQRCSADLILKSEEMEYYPLSSAQKRMYFIYELSPDSIAYNMPSINFIGKSIDFDKIEKSLSSIIQRHEILRTTFESVGDTVYQKIHKELKLDIENHTCNIDDLDSFLKQFITPFRLNKLPIVKFAIVNVLEVGYILVFDIHHIISDGMSMEILIDDFFNLYNEKSLEPLELQYKDFSFWQNEYAKRDELKLQKEYWLKQFSDDIPKLNLATDRLRPKSFSFKGEKYAFTLDKEFVNLINEFKISNGGTLQMVLLTLLKTLLFKYTNQNDIVIGSGVSGRRHKDVEKMVGMFVNTLAIRSMPNSSKTFSDYFNEVKSISIEAYQNQDIQFDDLVDLLNIKRDSSRNPIFDVVLVVQNFEKSKSNFSTIFKDNIVDEDTLSKINYNSKSAQYDLIWRVFENENEITIGLEYYNEIYDRNRIINLVEHFKQLAKVALRKPNTKLEDMNLLSDIEETLLKQFSKSSTPLMLPKQTLHDLFEKQCELLPENVAVTFGNVHLTYQKLNEESNKVAHFLINEIGVKIEDRVGVLLQRGSNSLIALLGIIKAGACYVPIDPDLPEDRVKFISTDSQLKIIISEKKYLEKVNRLLWSIPQLNASLFIDSEDIDNEEEQKEEQNIIMDQELWDHIGNNATDLITGGGWTSSFTGEPLSTLEMDEYAINVYLKLKKYLNKKLKVLEIGCSSGITLTKIAPEVELYYGTDLSPVIIENTRSLVNKKGLTNVKLKPCIAHEIDSIEEEDFDLIIINSVIQAFHGHNYLTKVIKKSIKLLKNKGAIFIGDVMDIDKKELLLNDLRVFKENNSGKDYSTKLNLSSELFVSMKYFEDLIADNIGIVDIDITKKIHSVENELTKYRYDIILKVDKKIDKVTKRRNKFRFDANSIRSQKCNSPLVPVNVNNLSYLIYTSGSTGEPKGVLIEHKGAVSAILSQKNIFKINENHKGLQFNSLSFDASISEIFIMLLSGGSICIIPEDCKKDVGLFENFIKQNNIDVAIIPPAYLQLVNIDNIKTMKKLITGGESPVISKVMEFSKYGEYFNVYGPTETSIMASIFNIKSNCFIENKNIPIGKPLDNTNIYILNDNLNLTPVEFTGEICISGDGVARGYLNKPELTSEKFITNPFNPDEKLYRTGDLGRWLKDGNIDFIGRKDTQVKIRGYRIELEEIENIFLKYAPIVSVVVIVNDNMQDKRINAYFTSNEIVNLVELKNYLNNWLPEYMIPSNFSQLPNIPLSVNGKVNKKLLLELDTQVNQNKESFKRSANKTEDKILEIWSEVLNINKKNIGTDSNFFNIGGNSLDAMRIKSRITKEFEVEIELSLLFENPTVQFIIDEIELKSKEIEVNNEIIDEIIL